MAEHNPTPAPTAQIFSFGIPLQPGLRARLDRSAAESGRSMNAEIVALLERALDAPDDGFFLRFASRIDAQISNVEEESDRRGQLAGKLASALSVALGKMGETASLKVFGPQLLDSLRRDVGRAQAELRQAEARSLARSRAARETARRAPAPDSLAGVEESAAALPTQG